MHILSTNGWKDYELLDSGDGMRYERFGPYKTIRPDPQAIWKPAKPELWNQADVRYIRTVKDSGKWEFKRALPEKWKMSWKNIAFWARLTSFKHTGVFPEQVLQWEWMQEKVKQKNKPKILNLFAYTGVATIALAEAGAEVTHVDASKPSITWARENQFLSKLEQKPIRWILDDCLKFVEREVKRGSTYDGILMDPPVYGHGATGQIWKFNDSFPKLVELTAKLLSKNPLFLVVNAYAISSSSIMLENVMRDFLKNGKIESGELCLEETLGKRLLSTGIYARWSL